MKDATNNVQRRAGLSRFGWPGALAVLVCATLTVIVACKQAQPGDVTETPDQPHAREAQSDFLDLGKRAGIEWLSFVPNDQREYPALFDGLDRDQRRRLRLAPREWPDRMLIEFNLPEGSKLWPVQWYGTELMAIDLGDEYPFSVAIASVNQAKPVQVALELARLRHTMAEPRVLSHRVVERDDVAVLYEGSGPGRPSATYCVRDIHGRTGMVRIVVEGSYERRSTGGDVVRFRSIDPAAPVDHSEERWVELTRRVANSISIRRELALEGFPKHKCMSSIDELLQGRLIFPGGTLSLPLQQGHVARKVGGDSTVQIDGEGAQPWLILRRLRASDAPGDIRTRVRTDTTFARHVEKPAARFSAGYRPQDAVLPVIAWDFSDAEAGQQIVGVIAVGDELLAFEVPARGLHDGDARRKARDSALALLAGATGDRPAQDPLEVLEGWNIGTMGREK